MSGIILKNKRITQPNGGFSIDYANPISRGIIDVILDRNPITKKGAIVTTDTSTFAAGKYGTGRAYNNQQTVYSSKYIKNSRSIFILCDVNALTNYGALIQAQDSPTSNGFDLRLGTGSTDSRMALHRANTSYTQYVASASNTINAGDKSVTIGVTFSADVDIAPSYYIKGREYTGSVVNNNTNGDLIPSTSDNVYIGKRSDGVTKLDGSIYLIAFFDRELTSSEMLSLSDNPWQLFKTTNNRIFSFSTGAASHDTSGVIVGSGSTVAGSATHLKLHTSTGVIIGPGSTVSGTALHPHTTTGVLTGQGSTVSGTATHLTLHTSTGVITGSGSTVAGEAARSAGGEHTTEGTITGPGSTVVGSAAHLTLHTTTGALVGQGSTVAGTALHNLLHTTSGIIVGAGSTVEGTAAHLTTHDATGTIVGEGSIVSGIAIHSGEGAEVAFSGGYIPGTLKERKEPGTATLKEKKKKKKEIEKLLDKAEEIIDVIEDKPIKYSGYVDTIKAIESDIARLKESMTAKQKVEAVNVEHQLEVMRRKQIIIRMLLL